MATLRHTASTPKQSGPMASAVWAILYHLAVDQIFERDDSPIFGI